MADGVIPVSRPESRIAVIDKNGNTKFELTPVNKHEIVRSYVSFTEGMLAVENDEGLWGFVNSKGNVVIRPAYQNAAPFSEGVAVVQKDNDQPIIVINKMGETVFKLRKNWTPKTYSFQNGFLLVYDNNGRWMFVNKRGEPFKCPSKVKRVGQYNDDYYTFRGDDGSWGVMKKRNEEIVVRTKYAQIEILPGNKFLCNNIHGEAEILDSDGEKIQSIEDFSQGVIYNSCIGLLGKERNSYILIDDDGKSTTTEYAEIGTGITCPLVVSNYYDIQPVLDIVSKLANPKGVGKFIIGKTPQSVVGGSAEDYASQIIVEVPELTGDGYKLKYKTEAHFSQPMANYVFDYDTYSGNYIWNTDSKLASISTRIQINHLLKESVFNKIVDTLKGMGYKLGATHYKDNVGGAIFRLGNRIIGLEQTRHYDDTSISIGIADVLDDEHYKAYIKSLNDAFNENGSSSAFERPIQSIIERYDSVAVDTCAYYDYSVY